MEVQIPFWLCLSKRKNSKMISCTTIKTFTKNNSLEKNDKSHWNRNLILILVQDDNLKISFFNLIVIFSRDWYPKWGFHIMMLLYMLFLNQIVENSSATNWGKHNCIFYLLSTLLMKILSFSLQSYIILSVYILYQSN